MASVLVLYHSVYGHIEEMAVAEAGGARSEGADVVVKRVPETLPDAVMCSIGGRLGQSAAIAEPSELANYDAVIFGTPTRFGNMSGQMRTFLDRLGGLWLTEAMIGKVGSVFASSATQHGGQESTILTFIPSLLHLGMLVVGLPDSEPRQMGIASVNGGSPYGASTIAGPTGERHPSDDEIATARSQGRHVARIAARLSHTGR